MAKDKENKVSYARTMAEIKGFGVDDLDGKGVEHNGYTIYRYQTKVVIKDRDGVMMDYIDGASPDFILVALSRLLVYHSICGDADEGFEVAKKVFAEEIQ